MTFEELRDDLQKRGIDTSRPGFYDLPAYKAAGFFYDVYAYFVRLQPYSPEYLGYARAEIEALTAFLFDKVEQGGRIGACIDNSELMHRMLERRGVWGFGVKGGMTIQYKTSDLLDGYYWPWSLDQEIVAGHAWVEAPPFKVIDATIYLEGYQNGEQAYLPKYVLEENPQPGFVDAVDIMSEVEFRQITGEPLSLESIARRDPTLLPAIEYWGVQVSDHPGCTVKYLPIAITMSRYTLEEMEDNIECGTLPTELMREYEALREATPVPASV